MMSKHVEEVKSGATQDSSERDEVSLEVVEYGKPPWWSYIWVSLASCLCIPFLWA